MEPFLLQPGKPVNVQRGRPVFGLVVKFNRTSLRNQSLAELILSLPVLMTLGAATVAALLS
jgi:hypothetical protein